jgi:hypothetical protein
VFLFATINNERNGYIRFLIYINKLFELITTKKKVSDNTAISKHLKS